MTIELTQIFALKINCLGCVFKIIKKCGRVLLVFFVFFVKTALSKIIFPSILCLLHRLLMQTNAKQAIST